MIEIYFNFESPQTETLGEYCIIEGCEYIVINLTAHDLLYGQDEDNLIQSLTRTLSHEIIHALMSKECLYGYQEHLTKAIDKHLYKIDTSWCNYIHIEKRYQTEQIEGYG